MTVLQQVNFYKLVQAAMKVEKSKASNRERFQKMRLSRGASASWVREPESHKLSQYIVLSQGEEDKEIQ